MSTTAGKCREITAAAAAAAAPVEATAPSASTTVAYQKEVEGEIDDGEEEGKVEMYST